MQKKQLNQLNSAIHDAIFIPVNNCMTEILCSQENEIKRRKVLDLVITLKYWANPKADFNIKISQKQFQNYFLHFPSILNDPMRLIARQENLNPNDKSIVDKLIRFKLNKIADTIVEQQKLHQDFMDYTNNEEKIKSWWNKKKESDKKAIAKQYSQLSQEQTQVLNDSLPATETSPPRTFYYYHMCSHYSILDYYLLDASIRGSIELTRLTIQGIAWGIKKSSNALPSGNPCGGGNGDSGLIIAGIVGLAAIITSGIIGAVYAIQKTCHSIYNLIEGTKVARSLFRLISIGGGGYGGLIAGGIAGAALGSVVPVVGTFAGGIIGMVFGAGAGSGLGALCSKYLSRLISKISNRNANNPKNPDRYELSTSEMRALQENNFDIDTINQMLCAAKQEKNKISGSKTWPGSEAWRKKNSLNTFIQRIKSGQEQELTVINNKPFLPKTALSDGFSQYSYFAATNPQESIITTDSPQHVIPTHHGLRV